MVGVVSSGLELSDVNRGVGLAPFKKGLGGGGEWGVSDGEVVVMLCVKIHQYNATRQKLS